MRQLTNSLSEDHHQLSVLAAGESGCGEICHLYEIAGFALDTNPHQRQMATVVEDRLGKTTILFQQGPISQDGPNGVTIQSLLAVLGDHLQGTAEADESGLVPPGVLENLRNAVGILNVRDERLRAQATANTALTRVPALN